MWHSLGTFAGNCNGVDEVVHSLVDRGYHDGVLARFLRFVPVDGRGNPALRIGAYGRRGMASSASPAQHVAKGTDEDAVPSTVVYRIEGAEHLMAGQDGAPERRPSARYTRAQMPRGYAYDGADANGVHAVDFPMLRHGHAQRRVKARAACRLGGPLHRDARDDLADEDADYFSDEDDEAAERTGVDDMEDEDLALALALSLSHAEADAEARANKAAEAPPSPATSTGGASWSMIDVAEDLDFDLAVAVNDSLPEEVGSSQGDDAVHSWELLDEHRDLAWG